MFTPSNSSPTASVHITVEHTATDKESVLKSTTDTAAGVDDADPNKSVSRETTLSSLSEEAPFTYDKSSQTLGSSETIDSPALATIQFRPKGRAGYTTGTKQGSSTKPPPPPPPQGRPNCPSDSKTSASVTIVKVPDGSKK